MSTPLDLSTHQHPDGRWAVTVAGEIDMSNASIFAETITQARAKAEEGGAAWSLTCGPSSTSTRPGSPPCSRTPRGSN